MKFKDLCMQTTMGKFGNISLNNRGFRKFCFWPPNVFSLLASFLKYTGAYTLLLCPPNYCFRDEDYIKKSEDLGDLWFIYINKKNRYDRFIKEEAKYEFKRIAPSEIDNLIRVVFSEENLESLVTNTFTSESFNNLDDRDKSRRWRFLLDLYLLYSVCDNACAGIEHAEDPVFALMDLYLRNGNDQYSYSQIPTYKAIVQSKKRVPQVGLGLNSFSHYLCYIESEVNVQQTRLVESSLSSKETTNINILLLPWPMRIEKENFSALTSESKSNFLVNGYQYFDYKNREGIDVENVISAVKNAGKVDFLIFPEATMSQDNYNKILQGLVDEECEKSNFYAPKLVICGTYSQSLLDNLMENRVCISGKSDNGTWETVTQRKHHRWCLDEKQIYAYGLQTQLSPNTKWWEGIDISGRELKTFHVDDLCVAPLICEDLARQDPVAEVIRSLGPNFTVALLLDGPQLKSRWSSRYASVLADDPGCSVLSVTCMGMIERSNRVGGYSSRVVALWNDCQNGYKEISLANDSNGVIIRTKLVYNEEFTADGRSDGSSAASLVYIDDYSLISY